MHAFEDLDPRARSTGVPPSARVTCSLSETALPTGPAQSSWEVPPERPEVHIQVDERGAPRSIWAMRWNDGSEGERGYIPCGGDIHDDRTFGSLTIASRLTVGWWYGTPRYTPFIELEIETAGPL